MAFQSEDLVPGWSRSTPGPRVTVVMPALNEAPNLPYVLSRLPSNLYELILVDGRSTDDTVAVAEALFPEVTIVTQTRRGKGNALACGFAHARGDIIVALDADGSTDPGEIPLFVGALVGGADFAKGSRFLPGGGTTDITRWRNYGNRWLRRITNAVHRTGYTDLCYGFNAFWRHCVPVFELDLDTEPQESAARKRGDGFEVETLLHIRAAQAGLSVVEVPSFERTRIHGRSSLRAPLDGLRILRTILAERWARKARARLASRDTVIDLTRYGGRAEHLRMARRSVNGHTPSGDSPNVSTFA